MYKNKKIIWIIGVILLFICTPIINASIQQYNITQYINHPPIKPKILTGHYAVVGEIYTLSFVSVDPDGDNISYDLSSWGDNYGQCISIWLPSGTICNLEHIWFKPGIYTVIVTAMDIYNYSSRPTYYMIYITNNKILQNNFFPFK